jgi:hypothetical protein
MLIWQLVATRPCRSLTATSSSPKLFVLKSKCETLTACLGTETKITQMLLSWHDPTKGFQKVISSETTAMQHSLKQDQGADDITAAFKTYFPNAIVQLPAPSLQEALEKTVLFGYSSVYIKHWYEPDLLASFRLVASGSLKVYMVNPACMRKALAFEAVKATLDDAFKENSSSDLALASIMKAINAERAAALVKPEIGCKIFHCTVATGEALYVPPGWFVSCASVNGAVASGIRKALFVQVNPTALASIKTSGDPEVAKIADVLLNVLSAGAGK